MPDLVYSRVLPLTSGGRKVTCVANPEFVLRARGTTMPDIALDEASGNVAAKAEAGAEAGTQTHGGFDMSPAYMSLVSQEGYNKPLVGTQYRVVHDIAENTQQHFLDHHEGFMVTNFLHAMLIGYMFHAAVPVTAEALYATAVGAFSKSFQELPKEQQRSLLFCLTDGQMGHIVVRGRADTVSLSELGDGLAAYLKVDPVLFQPVSPPTDVGSADGNEATENGIGLLSLATLLEMSNTFVHYTTFMCGFPEYVYCGEAHEYHDNAMRLETLSARLHELAVPEDLLHPLKCGAELLRLLGSALASGSALDLLNASHAMLTVDGACGSGHDSASGLLPCIMSKGALHADEGVSFQELFVSHAAAFSVKQRETDQVFYHRVGYMIPLAKLRQYQLNNGSDMMMDQRVEQEAHPFMEPFVRRRDEALRVTTLSELLEEEARDPTQRTYLPLLYHDVFEQCPTPLCTMEGPQHWASIVLSLTDPEEQVLVEALGRRDPGAMTMLQAWLTRPLPGQDKEKKGGTDAAGGEITEGEGITKSYSDFRPNPRTQLSNHQLVLDFVGQLGHVEAVELVLQHDAHHVDDSHYDYTKRCFVTSIRDVLPDVLKSALGWGHLGVVKQLYSACVAKGLVGQRTRPLVDRWEAENIAGCTTPEVAEWLFDTYPRWFDGAGISLVVKYENLPVLQVIVRRKGMDWVLHQDYVAMVSGCRKHAMGEWLLSEVVRQGRQDVLTCTLEKHANTLTRQAFDALVAHGAILDQNVLVKGMIRHLPRELGYYGTGKIDKPCAIGFLERYRDVVDSVPQLAAVLLKYFSFDETIELLVRLELLPSDKVTALTRTLFETNCIPLTCALRACIQMP